MNDGLVDTNVFIHALANDAHTEECRQFVRALKEGTMRARLDPMVVHELTYALPRYVKQLSQADVADYVRAIVGYPGVDADEATLIDALARWERTSGLGFVDAYLAAIATRDGRAGYMKNRRHLPGQGVAVPNPRTKLT